VTAYRLRDRLERGEKPRVLFVNDVGFQYGAGIAQLRQIQSFLLTGHEVAGLCWAQGAVEAAIPFVPQGASGRWTGMREMPHLGGGADGREARILDAIHREIAALDPDLVVVGNLHGASWPLQLLREAEDPGRAVVAFMHDCYLMAGRCAYPGDCRLYETGCDENCPTAHEYPALEPGKIPGAYRERRELFCGPSGIPIAANSEWTLGMARRALAGLNRGDVIHYGVDVRLFRPIERKLARRLLGLPADAFVVLGGAINVSDVRKGTRYFLEAAEALKNEAHFLVFGAESHKVEGVQSTGFLRDYRKMPIVYSAADLFLGTALEEAFGQTLCEAAACGIPAVAFAVGGVPEVARAGLNALLIPERDTPGLIAAVRDLAKDPVKREAMGKAGRELVEAEFTLHAQGARWVRYLDSLAGSGPIKQP